MIALDTETHLIEPGLLSPRLVCVTTYDGASATLLNAADGESRFRELLNAKAEITFANGSFDLAVFAARSPDLIEPIFTALDEGRLHDVQIRESLLAIYDGRLQWETQAYGRYPLAFLSKKYLDKDRSAEKNDPNAWRLRYAELEDVPIDRWPDGARTYALDDAIDTYKIHLLQNQDPHNLHDEANQMRAHWALHLMSCWGMRTDPAAVLKFTQEVENAHAVNRRRFYQSGFLKVVTCAKDELPDDIDLADPVFALDPSLPRLLKAAARGKRLRYAGDTAALAAAVTKAYDGQPPLTATKRVSTARDTLVRSGVEILNEFGDASGIEKLRTTYVPIVRSGTAVPINPRYNVLVDSGRTSCEKPNIQNPPRKGNVRQCFVPRPGWIYVSNDYTAGELTTLAEVLHCLMNGPTALGDALRAGQDPLKVVGSQILAISYEEIARRITDGDKGAIGARQLAKPACYGLPGGLGAAKLVLFARGAYGNLCELSGRIPKGECLRQPRLFQWMGREITPTCQVCMQVSVELKQHWLAAFPEMPSYFDYINSITQREDPRITQLVSERIRGGVGYCDAANTMFQGLLADAAKAACYRVSRQCYKEKHSPLYGCRPVAFLHDEIILEAPVGQAQAAGLQLSEVMNETLAEYCPHVPCRSSPAWMWRWIKGAEGDDPVDLCGKCGETVITDWNRVPIKHAAKESTCASPSL